MIPLLASFEKTKPLIFEPPVSMLMILSKQPLKEAGWFFVSADVRGGGTRDEALRTSAWETRCCYH